MSKAEMYAEQFDHQWIAQFGICKAEIDETGDIALMNLYLTGLWAYLLGKGLKVSMQIDPVQLACTEVRTLN